MMCGRTMVVTANELFEEFAVILLHVAVYINASKT